MKNKILFFDIPPYYSFIWNKESGDIKIKSNSKKKRGEFLSIYKNPYGYLVAKVRDKQLVLHQFVAEKLFGPKKKGFSVNHIDGNKLNNAGDNLEYITIAENIKHAVKLGLHVSADPKRSGRYKDGRATKDRIKQYKHEWYIDRKNKK